MRGLFAASWIVVSTMFAVHAFAQTPSDAARATIDEYFEAFNSGNVPAGLIFEHLSEAIKNGAKFSHKIERIEVEGPFAWAAGQYTVDGPSKDGGIAQSKGAWLQVLKQEDGAWKFQAMCFSRGNQPEKE